MDSVASDMFSGNQVKWYPRVVLSWRSPIALYVANAIVVQTYVNRSLDGVYTITAPQCYHN